MKRLRDIARTAGVNLVREDASRQLVNDMVSRVRATQPAATELRKLEKDAKLFEKTFALEAGPEDALAEVAQEPPAQQNRFRGRSFLLTFNWDFLGATLPDGTPAAEDVEKLWRLWKQWRKEKKKELGVTHSSHTLEESLHSDIYRVHFHWKLDLREAIDSRTGEPFHFHGVRPDVRKPWAGEGDVTAWQQGAPR